MSASALSQSMVWICCFRLTSLDVGLTKHHWCSTSMVVSLQVVVGNWILGPLLALLSPACSGQLCSLRPKDIFIIIYKYTVAVFRRTRRRHQILLWVVVGIWTQDLQKIRWAISPAQFFLFKVLFILCIRVHCTCTDGCEPLCGCWELNFRTSAHSGRSHSFQS